MQNAANFYSAASKRKLQSRLGGQLQLQDADSALRGQLIRPLQRASIGASQEYPFSLADSFRSRIDHQLPREQLQRRDLQNGNFDQSSLEEETFNEAPSQTAAWNQRPSERQLQGEQLYSRDLQRDSFQDSSLTEETFSETASKTAAWQKRASDRQLLSQQLGRRALQKGNLRNSSLEDEAFRKATSETAALKTRPSEQQLQSKQLERHFASAWQTGAWHLSLAELQTRTLTPELSQLERAALHTELAELKRPALPTELEKLQPSSLEASFPLGGGSFNTSPRRGGVLSRACLLQLTFTSLTVLDAILWLKLRLLEKACMHCSLAGLLFLM